jgi:type II secretory pathway predicted ATPase ExeA
MSQLAKAAGSSLDFLGEGALQAVANAARGLPRVADQILGKACMLADAAGLKQVTKDVVKDTVGSL